MIETLRRVAALLSVRERVQLGLLAVLITAAAAFETLGVASVLPYMSVLTLPESEVSRRVFDYLYRFLGATTHDQALAMLGGIVLGSVVGGTLLSGCATWFALRFAMLRIHSISLRVLSSYLVRDYEFFIQRHSSALLKNLLSEVSNVVGGVLTAVVQLGTRAAVMILLVALLFAIDYRVAGISVGLFVTIYGVVYWLARRRLTRMGREGIAANDARYRILSELFAGIREVKLWSKEAYYFKSFSRVSERFADVNSYNQLIALVPRYTLEIVAFGGMVVVTMTISRSGEDFANFIPLLTLYAAAGYKILPSLQQIFVNLASIRYSSASLDVLARESGTWREGGGQLSGGGREDRINLKREIVFDHVTYQYPLTQEPAVGPLSLRISAFKTTGIVGVSGAGKSTVLDLLLGLLRPTSGAVLIDDRKLDPSSTKAWANSVGYVSQSTFLTEGTVLENIAFGTPAEEINLEAAVAAARAAQILDFINTLPAKFETRVGERGARLSGGQRQRIAIARALYRDPDILVFDEATSALDSETADSVMDALRSLAHRKTIVIVTHQRHSLKDCDHIIELEEGGHWSGSGALKNEARSPDADSIGGVG